MEKLTFQRVLGGWVLGILVASGSQVLQREEHTLMWTAKAVLVGYRQSGISSRKLRPSFMVEDLRRGKPQGYDLSGRMRCMGQQGPAGKLSAQGAPQQDRVPQPRHHGHPGQVSSRLARTVGLRAVPGLDLHVQ